MEWEGDTDGGGIQRWQEEGRRRLGEAGVYGESTFPSEALTLNRCDKVGL